MIPEVPVGTADVPDVWPHCDDPASRTKAPNGFEQGIRQQLSRRQVLEEIARKDHIEGIRRQFPGL